MLGAKRPIEHASNPLWVAPGGAQRARKADALLAAALQDQQAWAPWPLRELTVAQHLQQAEGRDLDRLGRVRLGQVAAGLGHALVLLHHRHDLLHGRLPRVGTAGSGFLEEVRFSGEPAGSLQSARRGGETALGAGLALRAAAGQCLLRLSLVEWVVKFRCRHWNSPHIAQKPAASSRPTPPYMTQHPRNGQRECARGDFWGSMGAGRPHRRGKGDQGGGETVGRGQRACAGRLRGGLLAG